MNEKVKRRHFSKAFKSDAVRLALSASKPMAQVADDLGVHPNSLKQWIANHHSKQDDEGREDAIVDDTSDTLRQLRSENAQLKSDVQKLKKSVTLLCQDLSVIQHYRFIKEEKANHAIATLCSVMQVSRSGLYDWLSRPMSKSACKNVNLLEHIKRIFEAHDGRYGFRRIWRALLAEGHQAGKHRVARIMRENGLVGRP